MTIARSIVRASATALLLTGLAAVGTAPAQENQSQNGGNDKQAPQGAQQASPQAQEMMQLQQRMRELQKEIGQLQKQALENNPELKKQRDELKALVNKKMRDQGVDIDAEQKRLKEIRKKMQGGDVSREEQQALAKEFRNKRSNVMKARRSAMQDPQVQKGQKQLRSDLEKAMKKADPKAGELIKEYREVISKLRQQRRRTRGQREGRSGSGSSGGDGASN